MKQPTGLITLETIQAGDLIRAQGDRAFSPVSGTVSKANRVTLILATTYFDKPMTLKIRRGDLRGELRAIRDGQLLSSLYQS
jgi:hypothetical protein